MVERDMMLHHWDRSTTGSRTIPSVSVESKAPATVLVVDDDASMLRAIQRLLSSVGFQVLTFDNAEAVLGVNLPSANVCLVSDIHLPGANGVELIRSLRKAGRRIPAILMTAHTDNRTRHLADSSDAIATLSKPFDEELLIESINRALKRV
jgi:two-component system, LuxR family, response regulator FixJ